MRLFAMRLWTFVPAALAVALLVAPQTQAADGPTLKAVKERGRLICGVDGTRPGIAALDSKGVWRGFDVDFCRAVSAAIFGDADKVKYVPLNPVQRFPALQGGEIDLLIRVTTKTLTRDTALGFNFAPMNMYAHTAIMVHKELGVKEGKELDGASVCVPQGSTIEKNAADFAARKNITLKYVTIENLKELNDSYLTKRCDVMINFLPGLALIRAIQAPNPADHVILPDVLVKEPLGPAVRHGDDQWLDIVSWSVYATFEAEEKGLTKANVDQKLKSNDPGIRRFLGISGDNGEKLGVRKDYAYQIVKQLGHYGEIWERNIGKDSPLKLDRGLNTNWRHGGLLYSPVHH